MPTMKFKYNNKIRSVFNYQWIFQWINNYNGYIYFIIVINIIIKPVYIEHRVEQWANQKKASKIRDVLRDAELLDERY